MELLVVMGEALVAAVDDGSAVVVDRPVALVVVFSPHPASTATTVSALKMMSNRWICSIADLLVLQTDDHAHPHWGMLVFCPSAVEGRHDYRNNHPSSRETYIAQEKFPEHVPILNSYRNATSSA